MLPALWRFGTYSTDTVNIVGSCLFYLVHLGTKKLQEVTFYAAKKIIVSCCLALQHLCLGFIQPHTRLDYLPPRTSFTTSSLDHPRKTMRVSVHRSKKEVPTQSNNTVVTVPDAKQPVPKLVTSKEQILQDYPNVLTVLDAFLVPHIIFR